MNQELLGVFNTAEEAIDAAYEAQKILMRDFTTVDRDRFIQAIKDAFMPIIDEETEKEFIETGYGRLDEKLLKNRLTILSAPGTEALETKVFASGKGLTVEYRAPYGLIAALTPVTNGIPTVASNTMAMIAGGNTVVFNAHPAGKEAAAKAVDIINRAIVEAGGPANLCTMPKIPTLDTLDVMMKSKKVSLLIGTGGEAMVEKLMSANKKVIAAGPGNPPVIVDETADYERAAEVLMQNVPMENTMLCITEKEAFVVKEVFDKFMAAMQKNGARLLTKEEEKVLANLCVVKAADGSLTANKKFVGRDPNFILKEAGLTPSEFDVRLLIIDADFECPFVMCEQLMPIFPVVKCENFEEAMDMAVKAEKGCRHSAAIWSNDTYRVTEFGKRIETSCYVQNGCTAAATGIDGTGEGSATIATGTGEGFTTPSTFTRVRRFAMAHGENYIV